ncbi:hypothetical protein [Aeromonas veronii]|uniref:hypothetical protein n=1 Tax=Aeromonas veronii TaxID=654 RepID=UPI002B2C4D4F|nr:hypothetical protein VAWG002_43530 [Aeromonas veronii]
MSNPSPLCKDCIHHHPRPGKEALCARRWVVIHTDHATGVSTPNHKLCQTVSSERTLGFLPWRCGKDGKFFTPAEETCDA